MTAWRNLIIMLLFLCILLTILYFVGRPYEDRRDVELARLNKIELSLDSAITKNDIVKARFLVDKLVWLETEATNNDKFIEQYDKKRAAMKLYIEEMKLKQSEDKVKTNALSNINRYKGNKASTITPERKDTTDVENIQDLEDTLAPSLNE